MLLGIIILVIVGALWSLPGVILSQFRDERSAFIVCSAISSMVTACIAWAIYPGCPAIPESKEWLPIIKLTILLGGTEVLRIGGLLLIQQAMKYGHNGQVWMVAQSAFILPFCFGAFFLGDPLTPARMIGMGLCLLSLVLLGTIQSKPATRDQTADCSEKGDFQYRWQLYAIIAFFLLGTQQSLLILPSYNGVTPDVLAWRVPVLMTWSTIINVGILCLGRTLPKKELLIPSLKLAAASLVSMVLLFRGLDMLAQEGMGSLAFAIMIAACILSFTLYSALRLREAFGVKHGIGMAGILIALIFFSA